MIKMLIATFLFLFLFPSILFPQNPNEDHLVYHIAQMDSVVVKENNVYRKVNDTALHFTVYYPKNIEALKLLPAIIFNNGVGAMDIPQWGQYKDWGRLIAATGMIAVTYQARPGNAQPDGEMLVDYVAANGKQFHIDTAAIGLWTCSANTPVAMRMAFKTRQKNIKALVVYYGLTDTLGELRQDLPTLLVRAGLDVQSINAKIENFIQSALEQDVRIEFINFLNGMHAFDLFTNSDESRTIIKQTVTFLKEKLTHPVTTHEFTLTNRNFMWLMKNNQSQRALAEIRKAREIYKTDSSYNPFFNGVLREQMLNANAYWLMDNDKKKEALQTFKFIAETYPESPNAFDGVADAYEALGNKVEAIKSAKVALEKLNASTNISPQFREAIRKSAEEKIKKLQ